MVAHRKQRVQQYLYGKQNHRYNFSMLLSGMQPLAMTVRDAETEISCVTGKIIVGKVTRTIKTFMNVLVIRLAASSIKSGYGVESGRNCNSMIVLVFLPFEYYDACFFSYVFWGHCKIM